MQDVNDNNYFDENDYVEDIVTEDDGELNSDSEFLPEEVEVVGVRFKQTGKIYYFDPCGNKFSVGTHVLVRTARGVEYASVALENTVVSSDNIVPPLRSVIRAATKNDEERHEANIESEKAAFRIFNDKIREHGLEMKLVDVEYTFDNNRLTFYFTADGRVDFRELVKDLASVFKTRIELRQIGIRDETKIVGGLGVCGRPFCCSSFLPEFSQVSIKMAKEQNLSLNSAKISGVCGKLMCCLRFEHDTYEEELKRTPKVDSVVITPDGEGVVSDANPLTGIVKVKLFSEQDKSPRSYKRDDIVRTTRNAKDVAQAVETQTVENETGAEAVNSRQTAEKSDQQNKQHKRNRRKQRPMKRRPRGDESNSSDGSDNEQ